MSVIFDILFLLIVVGSALWAAKKGFIRALIEFVGFFLALVLSVTIGGIIADSVYMHNVRPAVTDAIASSIDEGGSDAIEKMPEFLQNLLVKADVDTEELKEQVGETAKRTAEQITDNAVKPIAVSIVKSLLAVIIFILLLIAVKILARIINSMFKGKVLGTTNFALGAVLGGAKGIVYSSVMFLALGAIASLLKSDSAEVVLEALNGSVFFKCVSYIFAIYL